MIDHSDLIAGDACDHVRRARCVRGRPWFLVVIACLTWMSAALACTDENTEPAATTASTETTSSGDSATMATTASAPTTAAPATATSTTATSTTATSTTEAPTTSGLPGTPFDGFVREGDVLAVLGVEHDDQLNVRERPGVGQAILARLAPLEDGLIATGRSRSFSQSIWYEITTEDGVTGWANSSFLGFAGTVDDATSEFLAGADRPVAETMQELGDLVAASFASVGPASRVVMSVAPTTGDLDEVTYDVVGIGDDAVSGYRLHIFAVAEGETFSLRTIERTTFCGRGLAGELCV